MSTDLLKDEWDRHWIDGKRELLTKTYRFETISEAAEASVTIAKLSVEFKVEDDINLSISNARVLTFINAYNDGPLSNEHIGLSEAIDKALE